MLTKEELKRSGFLREEDLKREKVGYIVGLCGGPNYEGNRLEEIKFFDDFISSNSSNKYGYSVPDRYTYAPGEDSKFKKLETLLIDNLEYFLERNYAILWILDESIKSCKEYLSDFAVEQFMDVRNLWVSPTVNADPMRLYPIWCIEDNNVKDDLNIILYHAASISNKYSDTIRRIFKFYGKECIWSYLQGCKIPDEYKATAAEIVSQVMDVFDNSERPDEWKPKMQSLLIETIQECLVIANKYITDNDDTLLESRLEILIKTAAKKYVELDKDDVVEETQQQSSSSEDKSQVIDAPQIGYDKEFNSTPKYDDLKAYDAFIKQQQQEIVESYLKGREERMKQNKTIDTVATVDNNGKVTYVSKDEADNSKARVNIADYILAKDQSVIWTKDPNTGKKGFTFFNYGDISDIYAKSKKTYYMIANAIIEMVSSEAMEIFLCYEANPVFTLSDLSDLRKGEMLFFTPLRRYVIKAKYDKSKNTYSFETIRITEGGDNL